MALHSTLTGSDLHEPKGISTASAGEVYVADGAGSGAWEPQAASGVSLQQRVITTATTSTSCTTVIPLDNTKPQNTEGNEIFSASITPVSASSKLKITVSGSIYSPQNLTGGVVALFQDSGANAIAASVIGTTNSAFSSVTGSESFSIDFYIDASSTSARTYKVRLGPAITGTLTFNYGTLFDGVNVGYMVIEEWMP